LTLWGQFWLAFNTSKISPKSKEPPPLFQAGTTPLVLLDANILMPEYLRAVFLDLGDADLFRPYWSAEILKEVRRNLIGPKVGLSPVNVDHTLTYMKKQLALIVEKKTCMWPQQHSD